MKHESFDEREIYMEGMIDGLTLALNYPQKAKEIRDKVAWAKAAAFWKDELKELELIE